MQTCPSAADGPSIVVGAVEDAHRAFVANPSTPLPPPCVLVAFAHVPVAVPDTINAHAIALAAELARRGGTQRELHESEVLLYSRAHRYAEVSRAYDALAATDPQPSIELARAAIVAARQRADTATLLRILTRTTARSDAPAILRSELNVLRQVAALHSAIAEARGLVRQNPKYVAGYPSLVGNFGTLGMADSVVTYIRRALANGATRASLTSTVDPREHHAAPRGALWQRVPDGKRRSPPHPLDTTLAQHTFDEGPRRIADRAGRGSANHRDRCSGEWDVVRTADARRGANVVAGIASGGVPSRRAAGRVTHACRNADA